MKKETNAPKVFCSYTKLEKIDKVKPHPKNPNVHNEKQVKLLAKIIEYQGWRNPVVISNLSGLVVAGHGRLQAAKQMGLPWVPVDFQDFDNEKQELEHMLADNRIAELAQIDEPALREIMKELQMLESDLDMTGFLDKDVEKLFKDAQNSLGLNPSENNQQVDANGINVPMPSHVRMVQLFLNVESQPIFIAAAQKLQHKLKTSNLTETVYQVIKNEADKIK